MLYEEIRVVYNILCKFKGAKEVEKIALFL